MASSRELERHVKISNGDLEAEIVAESLPVYEDLGWTLVEDNDSNLRAVNEPTPQEQLAAQQRAAAEAQRRSASENK